MVKFRKLDRMSGITLFVFWNETVLQPLRKKRETMNMDVLKMLADLRQEREQIEEAIMTLERLAQGRGRRRGRPPAWMTAVKRRGRPPGSKNKPKEPAAA
ncbi:MAG: hypothetical protein ACRD30_09980 [Bryobacteraceae bacterium]